MKRLVTLVLLVGAAVFFAKLAAAQKAQWQGLTETEAREKIESRLPSKVPSEKRREIADKIVAGMREGGVLVDDHESAATEPDQGDENVTSQPEDGGTSQVSDDTTTSA